MVPWSSPSLSRCPLSYCWDAGWSSGWRPSHREACKAKAETGDDRAGRTPRPRAWSRKVRRVFSADAEGFEERFRWSMLSFSLYVPVYPLFLCRPLLLRLNLQSSNTEKANVSLFNGVSMIPVLRAPSFLVRSTTFTLWLFSTPWSIYPWNRIISSAFLTVNWILFVYFLTDTIKSYQRLMNHM